MRKRKSEPRPTITVAGAHQGASFLLSPLSAIIRETASEALVRYVDPVTSRVEVMAAAMTQFGVGAEGIPQRLEDLLAEAGAPDKVVVLTLDRPASAADALRRLITTPAVVMCYCLLALPNDALWGVGIILTPDDTVGRSNALRFFETLARVTMPSRSRALVGEGALPEHLLGEALLRSWMVRHFAENLRAVLLGLPITALAPLTVTDDGASESPLFIREWDEGTSPDEFPWPLRPGSSVVVTELSPEAIRFRRIRLRPQGTRGALTSVALAPASGPVTVRSATSDERTVTIANRTAPMLMTD